MRQVEIEGKTFQVEDPVAAAIDTLRRQMEGPRPGKIFAAISSIMKEVGPISKARENVEQKFRYRSIDQFYNAVSPLFGKYGVFSAPKVLDREDEPFLTGTGKTWHRVILKIRYTFYAEDGSNISVEVYGEGTDSGDKGSNKAEASAHKYALMQLLCVPTEELKDLDPDGHTPPEAVGKKSKAPEKPAAPAAKPGPAPAAKPLAPKLTIQSASHEEIEKVRALPDAVKTALKAKGIEGLNAAADFCRKRGWEPEIIKRDLGMAVTATVVVGEYDDEEMAGFLEFKETIAGTAPYNLEFIRQSVRKSTKLTSSHRAELESIINARVNENQVAKGARG